MRSLVACFLHLALMSFALAQDLPAELPPDEEEAALRAAESLGQMLFVHDRAAAVATDAVRELGEVFRDGQMRGWITEEVADSIFVTFIVATPKLPLGVRYRVVVAPDGSLAERPARFEEPRPLSAFESAAATARHLAGTAEFGICGERYNTVVLPIPNAENRWAVYLIPGTTDYAAVPIGGAHRIEVDTKAKSVISQRAFSHSCLVLQNDPEAVAMIATHLLDPVPTEIHVFWNLWARKHMIVLTPPHGTAWGVENGKLSLLERRKE